jgi:capsid portal protein
MEVFGYALGPAVELRRLHADLARETDAKRTAVAQRDAERARAESAVTVARLQARTIERLMASNERMVGLVADMRRVGFGILEPLGDVNDTPTTIDEADREAVQADPDLEADEL